MNKKTLVFVAAMAALITVSARSAALAHDPGVLVPAGVDISGICSSQADVWLIEPEEITDQLEKVIKICGFIFNNEPDYALLRDFEQQQTSPTAQADNTYAEYCHKLLETPFIARERVVSLVARLDADRWWTSDVFVGPPDGVIFSTPTFSIPSDRWQAFARPANRLIWEFSNRRSGFQVKMAAETDPVERAKLSAKAVKLAAVLLPNIYHHGMSIFNCQFNQGFIP